MNRVSQQKETTTAVFRSTRVQERPRIFYSGLEMSMFQFCDQCYSQAGKKISQQKSPNLAPVQLPNPVLFERRKKKSLVDSCAKREGVLRQRQSDYKIIYWLAQPNKREGSLRDLPNLLFIYGLLSIAWIQPDCPQEKA